MWVSPTASRAGWVEFVAATLDGVLVIDKPQGPTSHDIVAEARRALRTQRVGHTGTLDPLATGVLPLVIGQATRLSQFLTGAPKGYDAHIRLGVATDTYDAAGEPTGLGNEGAAATITDAAVAEALETFRGNFEQMPPPYSAKKVGGVRAYALARRREDVPTKPVTVTVDHLELIARDATRLTLRIDASAGFYVRSLAHDLGQRLGCGAHLEALRRYRSGMFTLDDAITVETMRSAPEETATRLVRMEQLLPDLPVFDLSESGLRKARHGNPLGPSDGRLRNGLIPGEGALARLFSPDGHLVALARRSPGGSLQPMVVLG